LSTSGSALLIRVSLYQRARGVADEKVGAVRKPPLQKLAIPVETHRRAPKLLRARSLSSFAVATTEPFYPATGVHQALLSGVEGMAG
jgi:hypothetical protein